MPSWTHPWCKLALEGGMLLFVCDGSKMVLSRHSACALVVRSLCVLGTRAGHLAAGFEVGEQDMVGPDPDQRSWFCSAAIPYGAHIAGSECGLTILFGQLVVVQMTLPSRDFPHLDPRSPGVDEWPRNMA